MKQPWIDRPWTDCIFILLPPFFILAFIALFPNLVDRIQNQYSFLTWLIFVVFIDVAHVYASIFKTYLVPSEFNKNRKLYLKIPLICFFVSLILFLMGSQFFWSALAYVAVFHFIRQQYGFMRLYSRYENRKKITIVFDQIMIYNATLYPMLFWFMSEPRKFNWFVSGEFISFQNSTILLILNWLYFFITICYCIHLIYTTIQNKSFNFPKNMLILGTAISWYFGIVYFNNDLIFTMLNVVSHGIPYMALIYFREIKNKPEKRFTWLGTLKALPGLMIYISILLALAFSEEFVWELTVWNDWFSYGDSNVIFSQWQFLLVPLLALPQFTHYILDGFIWKSPKHKTT